MQPFVFPFRTNYLMAVAAHDALDLDLFAYFAIPLLLEGYKRVLFSPNNLAFFSLFFSI